MARIEWDKSGNRLYETGVDRGVLYPFSAGKYGVGSAWDGLVSVNESSEGGESSRTYADNGTYLTMTSVEALNLSIEAYSYPKEFSKCLGKLTIIPGVRVNQQPPKRFGFSYRSIVGNDIYADDFDYIIHIVFGCLASPSEGGHSSVNDSPEADTLSWDVATNPITIDEGIKTAALEFQRSEFREVGLANVFRNIEDFLYGTDTTDGKLPTYAELVTLMEKNRYLLDSSGDYVLDSSGEPIETFAII